MRTAAIAICLMSSANAAQVESTPTYGQVMSAKIVSKIQELRAANPNMSADEIWAQLPWVGYVAQDTATCDDGKTIMLDVERNARCVDFDATTSAVPSHPWPCESPILVDKQTALCSPRSPQ